MLHSNYLLLIAFLSGITPFYDDAILQYCLPTTVVTCGQQSLSLHRPHSPETIAGSFWSIFFGANADARAEVSIRHPPKRELHLDSSSPCAQDIWRGLRGPRHLQRDVIPQN